MDKKAPSALSSGVTSALTAVVQRNGIWRVSAALGALLVVLRFLVSKKKPTSVPVPKVEKLDLGSLGKRVKTNESDYDEDEYDVIIIGGGTAGCVLASRLSEDPSIRVLLLEAGKAWAKDVGNLIPAAASALVFRKEEIEYNLFTEKQANAGHRSLYWPRAKLLGGCTTINAMIFHYGCPSDYDEWAALQKGQAGSSGWTYNAMHPYFQKFERFNPSASGPNVDISHRGTTGLVDVGHFGHFSKAAQVFIDGCMDIGIPATPDFNTPLGTLGVTKLMTYIDSNGRRVTTEAAYLTPDVLARPNLKVGTKARVTRILFEEGASTRACGVEFADDNGTRFRAVAKKEVIVSAGAVHTPHILKLSGVGPAEELRKHNIPVVADLPGVGSHLQDHVVIDYFFEDKTQTSINYLRPMNFVHKLKLIKAIAQYQLFKSGPLTCNVAEAAAFVHSADPKCFPATKYSSDNAPEDLASGKGAPDIELFVSPVVYTDHGFGTPVGDGYYYGLHGVLLRPKSTGTVTLRSADPFDKPVIDPNYLADPNDMKVMVRVARLIQDISHTKPVQAFTDPKGDTHPKLHHHLEKWSDAKIEEDIRLRSETLYHPVSTARMAPLEDGGVVDPFLRVHGISNLRIADASVFPSIVSGHTAAPVIAIAEKAADLIKAAISEA